MRFKALQVFPITEFKCLGDEFPYLSQHNIDNIHQQKNYIDWKSRLNDSFPNVAGAYDSISQGC